MQNKLREYAIKLTQFMAGRNGLDKLSMFLILLSLAINGANSFIRARQPSLALFTVSFLLLAYAVFRMLSKNISARRAENAKFEKLLNLPVLLTFRNFISRKIKNMRLRLQYIGTHRFRTCPNCGNFLRLKKKNGRREITCPNCGNKMKVRIWL